MEQHDSLTDDLYDFIAGLTIIDTHEHMASFEKDRERPTDVLREYLLHYMNSDLLSAGLPRSDHDRAIDLSLPLKERWNLVEPFWEACRYTGYGRCLDASARGLYGINRIEASTITLLDAEFQKTLVPGTYKKVLKESCNIETAILDNDESPMDSDPEFFRSVYRIDRLVFPHTWEDIRLLEEISGTSIVSLDTYIEACTQVLETAKRKGCIGLKIALAYTRSLKFDRPDRTEAERGFNDLLGQKHIPEWEIPAIVPSIPFQDYILHVLMERNTVFNFPVQIHTGIHEGNGNHLVNTDPALLTNLFLEYPTVKFDLFHTSFPFQETAGVLAKNFPNVYLDMCWAHIVSPAAAVRTLSEWLDLVPANKIFGFGGDFLLVDGVYGHLEIARKNIALSLAEKVKHRVFTFEKACGLAEDLLYRNPKNFFGL